ncbi:hypothetical protein LOK49_LG10G00194 [Camellia lanceoleosa]|uniref:Uncharacterized protein n=1 Tax=Camellia lanceoleosa TaxID=1840588 RepID=A0ACC0GAU1_9ERIC|nr:hypothetical protein LOK49_LG10G00194 [Camellia lanceoleosa]
MGGGDCRSGRRNGRSRAMTVVRLRVAADWVLDSAFFNFLMVMSEVLLADKRTKGMSSVNAYGDLSSGMEVDAFRRLFLLRFHGVIYLNLLYDARKLWKARDTTLALG